MSRPTTPRAGLGHGFAHLFTANLSSSLGDGIYRVATPLLAARLTDDPLLISGIAALSMLPWLLFAIPSGVLIDRVDRRKAMAWANGVRTALALALIGLITVDLLTVWALYAVVFVYGALETVYDGALRAVPPSIVAKSDLPRANSRLEAGELVVQNFLAAPLTSALFALAVTIPLGINVAAFALAAVLALQLPAAASGVRRDTHPPGAHGDGDGPAIPPWRSQLADGLRFLLAHPMLRTLWLLSSFIGLCFAAATATTVLFALELLGIPEAYFGLFMLANAVGGLLGASVAGRLAARFGSGPTMAVANVASALALVVIGLWPLTWVAVIALAAIAASIIVWNVLVMSLRQSYIPGHLLGRVNGTWRTLLWGVMPIGSLLGGLLARVSLTTPLIVGGGLAAVAALIWFGFVSRLPNPEDARVDDDARREEP